MASETSGIEARDRQLGALDRELGGAVRRLAKLDEDVADAEQAFERSKSAAKALDTFSDAGVEDVHQASRDLRDWEKCGAGRRRSDGELAARAADRPGARRPGDRP